MKIWKRNAIVATVLVLICAGVYLNWNANQNHLIDLTQTLNEQQILGETAQQTSLSASDAVVLEETGDQLADYFAQIRLSRQESRDGAVELLQETMAYEDGSESAEEASASLNHIVSSALAESQIESLVIAKGFKDCVAYMGDDSISVAVSAPDEGLAEEDVALISDIVTAQTEYQLSDIRIIEVN